MSPLIPVDIFKSAEVMPDREGKPLYLTLISAGWPSPANDYVEDLLDLHKLVVKNEAATFFLRVSGTSMTKAGIHDGDLLVVDRSVTARPGKVVIAAIDGELTVKRLIQRGKRYLLAPESDDSYPEFDITDKEDLYIWGVVTYVIHKP